MPKTFEYCTKRISRLDLLTKEKILNDFGAMGWELVAIMDYSTNHVPHDDKIPDLNMVFKREKESTEEEIFKAEEKYAIKSLKKVNKLINKDKK